MGFGIARVPQDLAATGGKCSLLKWVTGSFLDISEDFGSKNGA